MTPYIDREEKNQRRRNHTTQFENMKITKKRQTNKQTNKQT